MFLYFIIVINEAPRKFFFWEQRLEIISRTCFLFVALLSNWKIALFVFRLWLVPGKGVNQGGHRGDKSI